MINTEVIALSLNYSSKIKITKLYLQWRPIAVDEYMFQEKECDISRSMLIWLSYKVIKGMVFIYQEITNNDLPLQWYPTYKYICISKIDKTDFYINEKKLCDY